MIPNIQHRTILYFIVLIVGAAGLLFSVGLPHPAGIFASVVITAIAGFCICLIIFDTKRQGQQLVCPTGSDCNAVVTSRYSRFFGVSLEYWGMAYFALIAVTYALRLFVPAVLPASVLPLLILLSIGAGLFSLYLLFVQAFLLRKWCMWCILTAMLSLAIFALSFAGVDVVAGFIHTWAIVFEAVMFLGIALGLGAGTAAALLFFHFLRDENIDEKELDAIKGVSELVWTGFALVLVSKLSFLTVYPQLLAEAGAFLAGLVALLVFALAGALLMIIYAPFLVFMPFQKSDRTCVVVGYRRPAAVLGAVALVSWYIVLGVQFVPLSISGSVVFSVAGGVWISAVLIALLKERSFRV